MAKNVIMKQYNGSSYEEIYPQTKREQVFTNNGENAFDQAIQDLIQIGDVKLSRNTPDNTYLACNGAEVDPGIYPELCSILEDPMTKTYNSFSLPVSDSNGTYSGFVRYINNQYVYIATGYSSSYRYIYLGYNNYLNQTTLSKANISGNYNNPLDITYINGYYIIFGFTGSSSSSESGTPTIWYSTTLTGSWTSKILDSSITINNSIGYGASEPFNNICDLPKIKYVNNKYIITLHDNSYNQVYLLWTASFSSSWNTVSFPSKFRSITNVEYYNGYYVCGLTERTDNPTSEYGQYRANIAYSTDLINWSYRQITDSIISNNYKFASDLFFDRISNNFIFLTGGYSSYRYSNGFIYFNNPNGTLFTNNSSCFFSYSYGIKTLTKYLGYIGNEFYFCRLIYGRTNPSAWLFKFTNPSEQVSSYIAISLPSTMQYYAFGPAQIENNKIILTTWGNGNTIQCLYNYGYTLPVISNASSSSPCTYYIKAKN